MEWIKRNLAFVVWGSASVLLLIAAGWFLFANLGRKSLADQQLAELLAQRSMLWTAEVHPEGDGETKNIDEVRKDAVRLEKFLGEIRGVIPPMPKMDRMDDQTFRRLLDESIFEMSLSTNAGIQLPDGFAFSFAPIRTQFQFGSNSVPSLALQLGDVRLLVGVLIQARVNTIDSVRRAAITANDVAGSGADYLSLSPTTNEFTVSMPYELTFRCFSAEIGDVLNQLMRSPQCVVVKSIDVAPGSGGESFGGRHSGGDAPVLRGGGYQRSGSGGRYGRSPPPLTRPGMDPNQPANPNQPTVVLNEQPLRVTLLVDVVRLAEPNAP